MILSLEGWPTKAKEVPSPHEVRMSPLDTNPVFQSLGGESKQDDITNKSLNEIFPYSNEIAELTFDKESEEVVIYIAGYISKKLKNVLNVTYVRLS